MESSLNNLVVGDKVAVKGELSYKNSIELYDGSLLDLSGIFIKNGEVIAVDGDSVTVKNCSQYGNCGTHTVKAYRCVKL